MKRALILALVLAATAARAQPPQADSDEAGLMMQVTTAEDDIKTSSALIRDPALNGYVRGIACKVAPTTCPALRVYIVEVPGMNLVSLPNGALVVWSGTLLRTENEAQLAQLLGHELAHFLHKDSLGQFHRMLATSSVVALLGVAASGVGINFVGTPASMAALSARYAHSQSEERAADATGFELATAAGYAPDAAAAVWRNANVDYLKLHPSDDRLAMLQDLAQRVPSRGSWTVDGQRAAIAPYLERWVDDELLRGVDAVALFTRLSASGRGLFRYGLGEAYRKRGQPGDTALAQSAFRAALAAPDPPPLAWRGLGLVAMQSGDKPTAKAAFAHYRVGAPDADDKAMIDYYLAQL
jgi:Zn-dependent protease with chaperone function